jgi:hypothetical protein
VSIFTVAQKGMPIHILVPASEYFPWREKGYISPIPELRIKEDLK